MNSAIDITAFKAVDADPGATFTRFTNYCEEMELLFKLVFRKSDGTCYTPIDSEKKAMLLLKGGKDMRNLFKHVGIVLEADTYAEAIQKIEDGLKARTNKVVQRNMLLANFPQGSKSFEKWSQEVADAARLISYTNYDWKQAAVDAMILQTSNARLRERALQEDIKYDDLIKLGVAKEQSVKGAALLEQASGQSNPHMKLEEDVRRLQLENRKLKGKVDYKGRRKSCTRCGNATCSRDSKCPANGKTCSKCHKKNHFAKACTAPSTFSRKTVGQVSSAEDSESEESCGMVMVGNLDSTSICAKVLVQGISGAESVKLATDTGISKTLLNSIDWNKIKKYCNFVKTSKRFRPYGTAYHLPIKGKAKVILKAENGAQVETWVYVVDDKREQSLLGKEDAIRLGIVKLNLKGAEEEVTGKVIYSKKTKISEDGIVSGGQTQGEIDVAMRQVINQYSTVFTDRTGKYKGEPIKIQVLPNAIPVIQHPRKIPLHYKDQAKEELQNMLQEDIIEGPIEIEEPGTFLSNLVITDKKELKSDTNNKKPRIRVTLDCQQVNKSIYPTHEPIPSVEELRHELAGSDRFSTLDMTNCYYQFEIEEEARKLYAFQTPWGIYRYKRMVMGTSPASSEIQKRIREMISQCDNSIHIKDDILVHGIGRQHDEALTNVLKVLEKKGITLRPGKCHLGKPEVKWFGNIFSKNGVSPDPEKCNAIKDWPAPSSTAEVKSFLQTIQFNSKFLGGKAGEKSYPELTEPLRILTKKFARFKWNKREDDAFKELKERLCSEHVLAPYDTSKKTRMYVDASPAGTQATIAQLHHVNGEESWRPVNHTSRSWTPAESRYGQIERESNAILTGMFMNKMYTLGTHVEVVTDHEPLVSIYNSPSKPNQHRVDRHRTKLLPFQYHVIYEAGRENPCDYGSRHPPNKETFTESEEEQWCIENGTDIYVNRVIEGNLPKAMTIEALKKATKDDKELQQLMLDIPQYNECRRESLKTYKGVFQELWIADDMIMKGAQVVIPSSLRTDAIALAHEGHQFAEKTLNLLRQTSWFPKMRAEVTEYVSTCGACNAAIVHTPPVPLQPNLLPDRPWQNLHGDFKGPIGGSYYLHVIIDQYSKYPEVDIIKSTSFEKLRPVLDRIFSTHGIPETLSTDNGPPYSSHDMSQYAKEMGFELKPVSPNDPQCNGFAENYVKTICKLIHTAIAEGKDPRKELYNHLLQYRATPHSTTEKSPAEMLFHRKIKTKLPCVFLNEETAEQKTTRSIHDNKRLKQKKYFDRGRKAKLKQIKVGDQVLVRQKKSTTAPPFDPEPYLVTETQGNRILATKKDGTHKVRDKNQLKKVKVRPERLHPSWIKRHSNTPTDYTQFEIDFDSLPENNPENNHVNDFEVDAAEPLFDIDQDMDNRLQELLQAADVRENVTVNVSSPAVTRSRGTQLEWNPQMNQGDVVIPF